MAVTYFYKYGEKFVYDEALAVRAERTGFKRSETIELVSKCFSDSIASLFYVLHNAKGIITVDVDHKRIIDCFAFSLEGVTTDYSTESFAVMPRMGRYANAVGTMA